MQKHAQHHKINVHFQIHTIINDKYSDAIMQFNY